MATRVAINGLGRIGRAFLKQSISNPEIDIVAVNDLGNLESLAYLLKYDSAYGRSGLEVKAIDPDGDGKGGQLIVNGHEITVCQQKDPAMLPWKDLNIDVVVESTGFFDSYDKANAHITAGAKRVVISAPAKKSADGVITGETVLMGINEGDLSTCQISSNASCTTNASSPVIQILHEKIGIEKAILNTTHAYTGTQKLVDSPDTDFRRGRAAAANMAPSSTGAAIAVTEVVTDLKGKFDGISVRVPVITGSLADVTFIAKRNTSVEEVNQILRDAAKEPRWAGVFTATDEQLVSTDIIGDTHASIADLHMTRVVDGNLVKVLAWYDNEMGYTHTLVMHVIKVGQSLK